MNTLHAVAVHAAGDLNTAGLGDWIKTHVLPLILIFIGLLILIGANRDKLSKNLGIGVNVIIAGVFIFGGAGLLAIGGSIASTAVK